MTPKKKKPEMPQEKRCRQCMGLLNILEDEMGNRRLWCPRCEGPFLNLGGENSLVRPPTSS